MDPVTIGLTAARTTKILWDVGSLLYNFIQSTKVVDVAVKSLALEITQLQSVCESVQRQLAILGEQEGYRHDKSGLVNELQNQEDIRMARGMEAQLRAINRAMEKLDGCISGVRQNQTNFLKQAVRQITFDMSKEDIAESRTQIRAHTSNLQLSLQLVTLKATYLAPKLANQDLLAEIIKLRTIVEQQGSTRLDSNLVQSAQDVLSSSATLYSASIADGSVIGAPVPDGYKGSTLDWLTHCDSLEASSFGLNHLDIGTSVSDSRSPSISSANGTSVTGATSMSEGGPHQQQARAGAIHHDATDIEIDVQEEIDLEAADTALEFGMAAFDEGDYEAADTDLKEALDLINNVPVKFRHRYNPFRLRFRLAICAYHIHGTDDAAIALESIVRQQVSTEEEALKLCQAGHLLAQIYIKQAKLDAALTTAENSSRVRRKLLGKHDVECYKSLALISRIFELLDNPIRAKTFLRMIPPDEQALAFSGLEDLKNEKSMGPETDEDTTLKQNRSTAMELEESTTGGSRKNTNPFVAVSRPLKDWNAMQTNPVYTLYGHSKNVRSVAFSKDETLLASGSEDKTVIIWNTKTGARVQTLVHRKRILSVVFSPDATLLAASASGGAISVWNVATGASVDKLRSIQHLNNINTLAFSNNGRLLASGAEDETIKIWDVESGTAVHKLKGCKIWINEVKSVAFSGDDTLLAAAYDDKMIRIWDVRSGELLSTLSGHTDRVTSVAFAGDSSMIYSGSLDGKIMFADAETDEILQTLTKGAPSIVSIAVSDDGRLLASGRADTTIRLLDTSDGSVVQFFGNSSKNVTSVALSANGKLLAAGLSNKTVRIWTAATVGAAGVYR